MTRADLGHRSHKEKIAVIYGIMQVILIVLYGAFARYDEEADSRTGPDLDPTKNDFNVRYGLFQDVHIMIFVGFGFLMTFLKRYGYSAVGFNFLIAALALQWAILVHGFINSTAADEGTFKINIKSLIGGDFAAAAVLISFGVLIGKTSPLGLLVLTIIEIILFEANLYLGEEVFHASDAGGSMFIHAFGAYFGLAAAFVLREEWHRRHKGNAPSYNSNLFAMIGSLFLWICWPTFNGALLDAPEQQHRTAINTYMSLAACVTAAICANLFLTKEDRLGMDMVQNCTLAGGVAVGTMANMMIYPWGAMIIGSLTGVVSVVGFLFIQPFLEEKMMLHDTCGVNNLHGMPGVIAGIAGVIAAACAQPHHYGIGLNTVFGAREALPVPIFYQGGFQLQASLNERQLIPLRFESSDRVPPYDPFISTAPPKLNATDNSTFDELELVAPQSPKNLDVTSSPAKVIYVLNLTDPFVREQLKKRNLGIEWVDNPDMRTAGVQAAYQLAALVCTLAIAISGGAITGLIIKMEFWIPITETQGFHDEPYWALPDDVAEEEKPHKFSVFQGERSSGSLTAAKKAAAAAGRLHDMNESGVGVTEKEISADMELRRRKEADGYESDTSGGSSVFGAKVPQMGKNPKPARRRVSFGEGGIGNGETFSKHHSKGGSYALFTITCSKLS